MGACLSDLVKRTPECNVWKQQARCASQMRLAQPHPRAKRPDWTIGVRVSDTTFASNIFTTYITFSLSYYTQPLCQSTAGTVSS